MTAPLKVGLAGLGTVGSAVVELLQQGRDKLAARCGRPIEIVAVNARSRAKKRDYRPEEIPLGRRSRGAGAGSVDRRVCRAHGRSGRSRQARGGKRACRRQAGGDRQQGAAWRGTAKNSPRWRSGVRSRSISRLRSAPAFRSSRLCAKDSAATLSRASTASSTAPAITSSPAWSRTASPSTIACATRSGSAMRKPIRPSTSKATTRRKSFRSWRPSLSAQNSIPRRSMSRASPRSRWPTSMRRISWAIA